MNEIIINENNKSIEPTVSVILPTYNRGKTLKRAVESVLNQTFSDLELIIVDDGSTDETREIINNINDIRLRYIVHQKQRGAGGARNTGIAAARGEYIAFQDSDDEWVQDKLEIQLEAINSNKDIGAVFSPYVWTSNGYCEQRPREVTPGMQGEILNSILCGSFIGTQTLFLKKSILDKSGYFNEELRTLEDWELSIRLSKQCLFVCIKKPLVKVYYTPNSVSDNEEIMFRTIMEIMRIHRDDYLLFPKAEAKLWTSMGYRKCYTGKMRTGKKFFLNAIKLDYKNSAAWLGFAAANMGKHFFHGLVSLKRRLDHATRAEVNIGL